MDKIKNKDGLPSWFKLKNYDCFESLSAVGWFEQITTRMHIKECITYQTKHNEAVLFLTAITKSPIIDTVNDNPFIPRDPRLVEILSLSKQPKRAQGVRKATVIESLMMIRSIGQDKYEYANKFLDESDLLEKKLFPIKYGSEPWFKEAVDDLKTVYPSRLILNLDLELSDQLLIKQFEALLKLQRKELSDQGVTSTDIQKFYPVNFVKFGVIPYIDLEIWSLMEGKDITYRTYADTIFKDGVGGEEVVRNTTKKLAEKILSNAFLHKLAAIAAMEEAEKNS